MRAMILAAGRGTRMRPLTDSKPKALIDVGGKPLITWHIEKLAAAGFDKIVINCAHLGHMLEASLGDGSRFGLDLLYSHEEQALETAGGIANALPLIGEACFAAVNADVFSDYGYGRLATHVRHLESASALAHLVLVDNPEHHPEGDFALNGAQVVEQGRRLTFSGIAAYHRDLFVDIAAGFVAPLAPLLKLHVSAHKVCGEHFRGTWHDIGTPQRLAALNAELARR